MFTELQTILLNNSELYALFYSAIDEYVTPYEVEKKKKSPVTNLHNQLTVK